jgi:vitamin B12 transporter
MNVGVGAKIMIKILKSENIRFGIISCAMALYLPVFAQDDVSEDPTEIDEVFVLGTRLSTNVPHTAEVISAEQIEAQQPLTVTDALLTLPGITAMEPGGAGGQSEVYLRGADANFTTVFVNGIQLNDPTASRRGGAFDFSSLIPGEIRRIEVVYGPFSAIYGSGALAGAINIDTRAPVTDKNAGELQGAIGTDGYWYAGGGLYGPVLSGHGGIRLNHIDFGEPTEGSTREVSTLSGNFGTGLSDKSSIDFTLRASSGERTSYPNNSGGPRLAVLDLLEYSEGDELSAGASYGWQDTNKSFTVFASYLGRQEFTDTPPIVGGVFSGVPASISDSDLKRYTINLQSRFQTSENIELGAGLEYQYEQGSSVGTLDFGFPIPTDFDETRDTFSPFAEGYIQMGEHSAIFGGLRYDNYSDVESALSPRVGFNWQKAPDGLEITISWGKGRKAPSFYALGDPLIGNPDLEPEDSEGWDIELSTPLGSSGIHLTLAAYQYDYTNLIDFDFTIFKLVNRSGVDTQGASLRLDGEFATNWRWSVYTTTFENEVEGVKDVLLHRPEFTAGGSVSWQASEKLEFFALAQYEDDRLSSSVPGGFETLNSYTRVNAVASYKLMEKTKIHLIADNLFDAEYEAMAGFPSPGRQFRVSVRQQF